MKESIFLKTGKQITKGVLGGPYMEQAEESNKEKQKYLVFPDGLNELEEMLKDRIGRDCHGKIIHSVFSDFKKKVI